MHDLHDLDELKRQWDQARSRRAQAWNAEREAEHRYAEAACAKLRADLDAQGFTEGTKVRVVDQNGHGTSWRSDVVAVGPVEWDYGRPRVIFYKIKADGTPGRAKTRVYFHPRHSTLELVRDGDAQ